MSDYGAEMSFNHWSVIKSKVKKAELLAASGNWDEVSKLSDELDSELRVFFENYVHLLSESEQAIVKEEGEFIIASVSKVLSSAEAEKKKVNNQAKKMAQGKKGVSAYKNS